MANNLRNRIIRLAHEKPELRPHLLPLLKADKTAVRGYNARRLHIQKDKLPHNSYRTDLYIDPHSDIQYSEPSRRNGQRDDLMSGTFFVHGTYGDNETNGLLNSKQVFAQVDFFETEHGMYYEVQRQYQRLLPGNKDLPEFLESIQDLIDRKFF